MDAFAGTEKGRSALAAAGRKHPGIFVSDEQLKELESAAGGVLDAIQKARRAG